jgi:hypothetical protein
MNSIETAFSVGKKCIGLGACFNARVEDLGFDSLMFYGGLGACVDARLKDLGFQFLMFHGGFGA